MPVRAPLLNVCSAILLGLSAAAQIPGPVLPAPVATIQKTVDEVNLSFTVFDKKGRFVSDLQPGDFQLLDNHQEPEKLTLFQQKSALPLHLALVLDASSSVQYRFQFERDAAVAFVTKIIRRNMDSVLLLTFNDQVTTIEDPTNNPQNLSKILRRVKTGGNTALYDAIIEASERLRRMPETQLTRRAIVLISDGVDTAKRSTLSQAMQACARAEVMIFTLSTNNSTEAANEAGDVILKNLAEATGGSLLPAHEERQLSSAFRTVERALRNQYVMAYNPASFQADGSFRTIQVIPRKRGLRAACRKGYYASWRVFR